MAGEAVGSIIGSTVQVADPEDNGSGGEFFRSKYNERDCEVWLRGKGNLKKEDQHKAAWKKGPALLKHHSLGLVNVVPKDSTLSSDFVFDSEQLMEDANPVDFAPTILGYSSISVNTSPFVSGLNLVLNDQKNNVAVLGGGNHVITNLDYQKDKLKAGHYAIHSNSTNVFAFQATKGQLNDISNRLDTECSTDLLRKW
nr:hypothetical protein CFP56_37812 [Quercus suber]